MSPLTDTQITTACLGHGHRLGLVLVCCLLLMLGLVISASEARAGTWMLVSCTQPDGQPAPTDGWSTSATGAVGPYSGDVNTCAQGGSLSAVTSGEAPQHPYEGPEWVFTAPAGSTIAGGTVTAMLTAPHGQAWLSTPSAAYDSADVLANCQYNLACGDAGTLSGAFPITHPGGTSLYAAAVCVGPYEGATSCPATGGLDAGVYVSAADIELANAATPAASGIGGTVLTPGGGGTRELTFDATDSGGPGVYAVTVQIDGTTVYSGTPDSNGGSCTALGRADGALMFDSAQPCKQSESVDLPINTTTLADGQHTLKVTVEDAAQNSSVVYDGTITTHNALAAQESLGALPGPGTSSRLSTGVGTPNGAGASEAASLRLGVRSRITRSYARRALHVAGRLLDAQGQPIGGASVDVLQEIRGSANPTVIGHAETRSNGTFTVAVPGGPSRLIEVAYRAFSSDSGYSAEAKIEESVDAGVQLHVTPHRTGAEGTITLSGRVLGPVPPEGVVVELLVHYRGRWEPFRDPRTDSRGRFEVVYQFQGGVGHFPFRALAFGGQAAFPFIHGESEAVDVTTN